MEHFLEGSAILRLQWLPWLTQKRRFVFVLIWVNVQICLNRALPPRKCFIKAPAKIQYLYLCLNIEVVNN